MIISKWSNYPNAHLGWRIVINEDLEETGEGDVDYEENDETRDDQQHHCDNDKVRNLLISSSALDGMLPMMLISIPSLVIQGVFGFPLNS